MKEKVAGLLVENSKRLNKLKEILDKNEIEYTVESEYNTSNIIVKLRQDDNTRSVVVLGAHYDIFPNSTGINDNTCSLFLLIEFIKRAKNKNLKAPIEIVFFDKEESGMIGSHNYAKKYHNKIDYALIFDIIGYGDTLIYGTKNNKLDDKLRDTNIQKVSVVLPSDNLSFEHRNIPVALITAVHKSDLVESPINKNVYDIADGAKFYSSFHGRENDNNIEVINFNLIESLLSDLSSTFLEN